MALSAVAEEYFRTMNPIAAKIHEDIEEARNSYENIWDTLTEKEKAEIINESIIKPEIVLKYALLDSLEFDINDPPVRKDNLMSFFGREHGLRVIQDENSSYRDEHSAPFLYHTKSQLNLCVLMENRVSKKECTSPPPILTELALSHSKVVNELKNALKSHDVLKSVKEKESHDREPLSPTGFISKFIGNFKNKDEDRECLVPIVSQSQIVASSENFFRTNFKSPPNDKFEKDYRSSVVKSHSDLSEENRGLLSSSQASSADFQSTETLTENSSLPKTGMLITSTNMNKPGLRLRVQITVQSLYSAKFKKCTMTSVKVSDGHED